MKKISILVLFCLVSMSLVSSLTIEKEYITNTLIPEYYNQPAEVILKITDAEAGDYRVYTLTDVNMLPSQDFTLVDGENEVIITLYPLSGLKTRGFYTFIYYLKNSSGQNQEDKMTVKVLDLEDVLEIGSESNYPGDEMTFYVKNKENANLKNLSVNFDSVFFNIDKTFDLGPMEKIEFTIPVDQEEIKKIPAGSYLIDSTFNSDKGEVVVEGKVIFGEKKEIETSQDVSGIFIRTETVTKINFGNTVETVKVEIGKNIFISAFTFFSEKPEGVQRDGLVNNYYWVKRINPSDTLEIQARTNYLIPLIIILIAVSTFLTLRKYTQAKLEISKSVSHVKTKGGEFALRVRLNVKAHKNLENVSIIERVPAIVKVYENFGALKPTSVNLKDRRLQWDLGNLQAGEERTFSYIIYSKVGVVGKFSLPGSKGIFEENGKVSETFSNNVFFLSEQIKNVD